MAIFDAKSNQPPEQYPLSRTPLNLILARDVNLGANKMVIGHYEAQNTTRVVAQDPKNPEYGTIELRVCDTPLTVERAAALACYLQCICRHLLQRDEPPPAGE